MTKELMYNSSSLLIVSVLLATILLTYEICFRIGKYYHHRADKELITQTNTIQAGILGLLALLLGFTFNMALQRFDNRSYAVIKEANAIGTTILRTGLLPTPYDSLSYAQLQDYVHLRIEASAVDLTRVEERKLINEKTDRVQTDIWETAMHAAALDPRPVTTGYYITSLNDMIDLRGERNAILQRHVPEIILFLLFLVFIINGALMGYSSGLGLRRASIPTIMLTVLIVLVVFIIIDLDRPKRGLIKVSQSSLIELQDK